MKTLLIIICLGLAACASVPETKYYVLSTPSQVTEAPPGNTQDQAVVGLWHVTLADYLKQSGLVLQTDTHQIRPANYHRWGEPLDRGIRRSLGQHLAANLPGYRIEPSLEDIRQMDYRLDVEVERFHGTESGEVEFSGRWTVYARETGARVASNRFRFVDSLQEFGYSAMIAMQSSQLGQLGESIADNLALDTRSVQSWH